MDNFGGKIYLDKKNPLSQSLTNTHFYLQHKKSESYPTIIQMLKSDLIKIQDMISSNSSDIKMYKLLSKTPGLTKKLSEIEESKNINIEKINESSKNIDKITKIYGTKNLQELVSKLFLELTYNEQILKKLNDYFILMKLKLYKDDTYQENLSKIISVQSFMEKAVNIVPISGGLDERIIQLSLEKEKLTKELLELKEKMEKNKNININIENNNKEITALKKENALLKKKLEEEKENNNNISMISNTNSTSNVKDSLPFQMLFVLEQLLDHHRGGLMVAAPETHPGFDDYVVAREGKPLVVDGLDRHLPVHDDRLEVALPGGVPILLLDEFDRMRKLEAIAFEPAEDGLQVGL